MQCSSLAKLLSFRCCATIGAGFRQCCPVQVPPPTVAQRQDWGCKLRENRRLSTGALITQVMSSCKVVSVTDVASPMFCGHTHPSSSLRKQQQQQQCNLERLRFNRRGASTPLWGVEPCSLPSRRPNPIPAITPSVVRTPHLHGAPSTEETSTVKL